MSGNAASSVVSASSSGTRKVYLPTGSLGIIFSGSPPTISEITSNSPLINKVMVGQVVNTLIIPDELEISNMNATELVCTLSNFANTPKRVLILSDPVTAEAEPTVAPGAPYDMPVGMHGIGQNPPIIAEATSNPIRIAQVLNQQSAVIRQMYAMLTDIRLSSHEATIHHLNQQIDKLQQELSEASSVRRASLPREQRSLRKRPNDSSDEREEQHRQKVAKLEVPLLDFGQDLQQIERKRRESNKGWVIAAVLKDLRQSGHLKGAPKSWKDVSSIPEQFQEKKLARNVLELCSVVITDEEVKILQSMGSTEEEVDRCVHDLQDKCMRQMLIYEARDPDETESAPKKHPTYISLGIRIRHYKQLLSRRLRLGSTDPPLQDRPPTPTEEEEEEETADV